MSPEGLDLGTDSELSRVRAPQPPPSGTVTPQQALHGQTWPRGSGWAFPEGSLLAPPMVGAAGGMSFLTAMGLAFHEVTRERAPLCPLWLRVGPRLASSYPPSLLGARSRLISRQPLMAPPQLDGTSLSLGSRGAEPLLGICQVLIRLPISSLKSPKADATSASPTSPAPVLCVLDTSGHSDRTNQEDGRSSVLDAPLPTSLGSLLGVTGCPGLEIFR